MATTSGAQPRNLDYYLQRMSGYSKNTIKIQPQTKFAYNAGDTVIFRLPTNSIIDLHSLQLKLTGLLTNTTANEASMGWPRFTQSLFRRVDVTMGGMQTGLGSLHDYGFLYNLLGQHKIPAARYAHDLAATDMAEETSIALANPPAGQRSDAGQYFEIAGGATSLYKPLTVSSWLGVFGGQFMRFLDTNILPDIEIRLMLAPDTICPCFPIDSAHYTIQNLSLSMESISFGDGSYRAIVDQRMASGDPLLVPFFNWSGFEGTAADSSLNQQFTIGTESLNAIMGTIRPGNYDGLGIPTLGGQTGRYYVPQAGATPSANSNANTGTSIAMSNVTTTGYIGSYSAAYNWYHTALSWERAIVDGYAQSGRFGTTYQFNIDSKLYPQFQADVQDCWQMLKNTFDANALSLTYGSSIASIDQFSQAGFVHAIGLDHHSDDQGKDHLISGLNTTGSLIPITWTVNTSSDGTWLGLLKTMCGGTFRPTVFANMTSTLMIYQGRTITVVN